MKFNLFCIFYIILLFLIVLFIIFFINSLELENNRNLQISFPNDTFINSIWYQYGIIQGYVNAFILGQYTIMDHISDKSKRYSGMEMKVFYSNYSINENRIDLTYKNDGEHNWRCDIESDIKLTCYLDNKSKKYNFKKFGSRIPIDLTAFVLTLDVTKCIDLEQFFETAALRVDSNYVRILQDDDTSTTVNGGFEWENNLPAVSKYSEPVNNNFDIYFIDEEKVVRKRLINNDIMIISNYNYQSKNEDNIKIKLNKEVSGYIFMNEIDECDSIIPTEFISVEEITEECSSLIINDLLIEEELNLLISVSEESIILKKSENEILATFEKVLELRYIDMLSFLNLVKKTKNNDVAYGSIYYTDEDLNAVYSTSEYTAAVSSFVEEEYGDIQFKCYKYGNTLSSNGLYSEMPIGYFWRTIENDTLFSLDEDHQYTPPNVDYLNVFRGLNITDIDIDVNVTLIEEYVDIIADVIDRIINATSRPTTIPPTTIPPTTIPPTTELPTHSEINEDKGNSFFSNISLFILIIAILTNFI